MGTLCDQEGNMTTYIISIIIDIIIIYRYAKMKKQFDSPLVYHMMYLYRTNYRIRSNTYKVIQHYLKVATLPIFPLLPHTNWFSFTKQSSYRILSIVNSLIYSSKYPSYISASLVQLSVLSSLRNHASHLLATPILRPQI